MTVDEVARGILAAQRAEKKGSSQNSENKAR